MPRHEHEFELFKLTDEDGRVYYRGYRCKCGEMGYPLPTPNTPPRPKNMAVMKRTGYIPKVGDRVRVKNWPRTRGHRYRIAAIENESTARLVDEDGWVDKYVPLRELVVVK